MQIFTNKYSNIFWYACHTSAYANFIYFVLSLWVCIKSTYVIRFVPRLSPKTESYELNLSFSAQSGLCSGEKKQTKKPPKTGPLLNIKKLSYQNRGFYHKDETVSELSYFYNGSPYTWKFVWYWNAAKRFFQHEYMPLNTTVASNTAGYSCVCTRTPRSFIQPQNSIKLVLTMREMFRNVPCLKTTLRRTPGEKYQSSCSILTHFNEGYITQ